MTFATTLIKWRHFRILGMGSPEIMFTLLFGFLVNYLLGVYHAKSRGNFIKVMISYFVIVIFIHHLFGVNTQLNWWLGVCKCPPNFDSLTGIFDC